MAVIKSGVFSWEDVIAQRYQNNKPTPLKQRRRTQSQSQPQTQLQDITYNPQPQSSLLSKLSPELRLLIWEYVLGGHTLHIIQKPRRRMGHVICEDGKQKPCEICAGGLPASGRYRRRGTSDGRDGDGSGLLGLGLVCRQTYAESTSLLYTHNTFEFSTTWSLPYLLPTLPSSHIHQIRSITLRWAYPGHWLPSKDPVKSVYFSAGRPQWVETCNWVMKLKGLRRFVLSVEGGWFAEGVERVPVFLEPLRELSTGGGSQRSGKGGGTWELYLPAQPYYIKEIESINADLRRRGFDCHVQCK